LTVPGFAPALVEPNMATARAGKLAPIYFGGRNGNFVADSADGMRPFVLLLLALSAQRATSSRARDQAWLGRLADGTRSLVSAHPMRWLSAEVRSADIPPPRAAVTLCHSAL